MSNDTGCNSILVRRVNTAYLQHIMLRNGLDSKQRPEESARPFLVYNTFYAAGMA
jgi:hypothetical protein